MGITNLLTFLRSKKLLVPFTGFPTTETLVAVDVPIFAHKFVYIEKTIEGLNKRFLSFAHELSKTCKPIFVFDGGKLALKDKEREKRHAARDRQMERYRMQQSSLFSSFQILDDTKSFEGMLWPTKEDYLILQRLLISNGFEVRQAKYEAEALCALLTQTQNVYAVLTEDSDALAFGAKRVIFKWFGIQEEACLETILKDLEFTKEQWIDFCCLLGNDFCNNVHDVGPQRTFALLKEFKRWPDAFASDVQQMRWNLKTRESAQRFDKEYEEVYNCFQTCAYELVETSFIE